MCRAETGLRVTDQVGITALHTMARFSHPVVWQNRKVHSQELELFPVVYMDWHRSPRLSDPWVLELS